MSSLTEEQRRRMEESRKKAMEKKAKLKAASSSVNSSGSATGTSVVGYRESNNFVIPPGRGNNYSSTNASYQPPANRNNSNNSGSDTKFKPISSGSSQVVNSSVSQSKMDDSKAAIKTISLEEAQRLSDNRQKTLENSQSNNSKPAIKAIGVEDAQRIAENRRKALEKRAQTATSNNNNSAEAKVAANFYTSSNSMSGKADVSNRNSGASSSSGKNSSMFNRNAGNSQGFNSWSQNKSSEGTSATESLVNKVLNELDDVPKPKLGKIVTGTIRLMSRERFVVEVGYHAQMVDIFKTMPSRKYDAETRKWNFALSDHDPLIEALKPLRPNVCVGPLPHFVQKTLQNVAKQMPSSCIDLFGLDPKLLDSLMPFQHEGVCFGVSRRGRVMIADDMGLGKTIQALGIATYYKGEWPLLIVTPSSVRYSWVNAIERWVTDVDRQDIRVLNSGKDTIDDAKVVITSYDLLGRRKKELKDLDFQVVIMDESHMLKSFKTARYQAASPIMRDARRVILLSGTPALSRPSELYTQISGINPSLFPRFQDFGVRYCAGKQQHWGWDFSGSSYMEELQIILESSLMIRRLKSEVLQQLPEKQRMMVLLDPGLIQVKTKAFEAAVNHFGSAPKKGGEKHGALLMLYAQSAVAKLKAVREYVKELLEGESKFLIFAHHVVMLNEIASTCDQMKIKYIRIDGKVSGNERQQAVNKFQNNDEVRVAVLSITAANAGITLTAAQLVVFAETFWNPGILVQAEDRAHRIGQKDCVTVQYLVAKGTVDDQLWPLIQSKLEVLNKAGLSKDTTLSGDATHQKDRKQGTIDQFLEELGDMDDVLLNLEDEENVPKDEVQSTKRSKREGGSVKYLPPKKESGTRKHPSPKKQGSILKYLSPKKEDGIRKNLSQKDNSSDDEEPQSKKMKS